jgi:hypothetical protein
MNGRLVLLLNLALSFYLIGTIWATEIDIFRSRKLVDPQEFHTVQSVHSHKLRIGFLRHLGSPSSDHSR